MDSKKKFHERFNIDVRADEARERFIHRTHNLLFQKFFTRSNPIYVNNIYQTVAAEIGVQYVQGHSFYNYVESDFNKCLKSIEAVYSMSLSEPRLGKFTEIIEKLFELTEVDIGVKWKDGYFIKTGAKELDKKLVNDSLQWLDKKGYETVRTPDLPPMFGPLLKLGLFDLICI